MFSKNDIVLLTETWLGEEASVQVNGFKHFQLNRTLRKRNAKRDSEGIIAYIRDELVTDTTLFMLDNDDLIWLRFDGDLFNLTDDLFYVFVIMYRLVQVDKGCWIVLIFLIDYLIK